MRRMTRYAAPGSRHQSWIGTTASCRSDAIRWASASNDRTNSGRSASVLRHDPDRDVALDPRQPRGVDGAVAPGAEPLAQPVAPQREPAGSTSCKAGSCDQDPPLERPPAPATDPVPAPPPAPRGTPGTPQGLHLPTAAVQGDHQLAPGTPRATDAPPRVPRAAGPPRRPGRTPARRRPIARRRRGAAPRAAAASGRAQSSSANSAYASPRHSPRPRAAPATPAPASSRARRDRPVRHQPLEPRDVERLVRPPRACSRATGSPPPTAAPSPRVDHPAEPRHVAAQRRRRPRRRARPRTRPRTAGRPTRPRCGGPAASPTNRRCLGPPTLTSSSPRSATVTPPNARYWSMSRPARCRPATPTVPEACCSRVAKPRAPGQIPALREVDNT